jgi:hypothetical protein
MDGMDIAQFVLRLEDSTPYMGVGYEIARKSSHDAFVLSMKVNEAGLDRKVGCGNQGIGLDSSGFRSWIRSTSSAVERQEEEFSGAPGRTGE